ncbi:hypothetical protein PEWE109479_03825 [Pedobacter westerhofensis]|uniref:hypothetical protein n=1 Tax=Pedobacter westerhofensis TaxID=425512 RepID=UPI0039EE7034
MKNSLKTGILVLFVLLLPMICSAQEKISIDNCGKKKTIMFTANTIVPADNNILVQRGFLSPINKSGADVEVRLYGQESFSYSRLRQIKFYNDSLVIASYRIYIAPDSKNRAEALYEKQFQGLTFIGVKDGFRMYVQSYITVNKNKNEVSNLLCELLDSHITDIPTGDVLDELAKKKYTPRVCNECGPGQIIELKVGVRTRNYIDMYLRFDNTFVIEKSIKELGYRRQIFNILSKLDYIK